jgi:hypothetical protein
MKFQNPGHDGCESPNVEFDVIAERVDFEFGQRGERERTSRGKAFRVPDFEGGVGDGSPLRGTANAQMGRSVHVCARHFLVIAE